jgi:hypothetical protein
MDVMPSPEENVPMLQGLQFALFCDLSAVEYEPATQLMHDEKPNPVLNVPAVHPVQLLMDIMPTPEEKKPASQALQ